MSPSRRKRSSRNLEGQPDARLLEIARADGDPEAFAVFYRRHYKAILGYLLRFTGNAEVASDLAQEVFTEAFDSLDRYDRKRGVGRAWLFGIAKNTLLVSYRKQEVEQSARRRHGFAVGEYGEEVWEQVESRIDASLSGLIDGLDQLPPTEREAVIARVVDEIDYPQIAEDSDASEAAIRQRVSRGLARLGRITKRSDR